MVRALPNTMSIAVEGFRKDIQLVQSSAEPPNRASAQQTVSGVSSGSHAGIGCKPLTIIIVKGVMRRREDRMVERVDTVGYGCSRRPSLFGGTTGVRTSPREDEE